MLDSPFNFIEGMKYFFLTKFPVKSYCRTPVIGLGLGIDFTLAWDNNNNNDNNNDNAKNNPHLNFPLLGKRLIFAMLPLLTNKRSTKVSQS